MRGVIDIDFSRRLADNKDSLWGVEIQYIEWFLVGVPL
jgi:hypothetical protein